jgi:hypothetical protein
MAMVEEGGDGESGANRPENDPQTPIRDSSQGCAGGGGTGKGQGQAIASSGADVAIRPAAGYTERWRHREWL